METNKIKQALDKIFERHRIVFWYDAKKELRKEFEALDLADIVKIELNNNEFGVKYCILREQPKQKFLLYHEGAQPQDIDNWMLDVQLAYGELRTDQASIWLSELELGMEFISLVHDHSFFFTNIKRRETLRTNLRPEDTMGIIRMKMLAVCTGSYPIIEHVLENLLSELSEDKNEKINIIKQCGLEEFLWKNLKQHYGYESSSPGIKDFVIELFKSCYAMATEGKVNLTTDALVFLKRWKDSRQYSGSFEKLSDKCAKILKIEENLTQMDYRKLIDLDYFKLIDNKILNELVKNVTEQTVSASDCSTFIRQRHQSHWYSEFENLYEAVEYASLFIHSLGEANFSIESMADGVEKYSKFWYKIDQLYRKFIYHVRQSGQRSLMEKLILRIENLYSNNYLLKVNDNWQQIIDNSKEWDASPVTLQKYFFNKWVRPFPENKKKIFIVISDALRYEIGEELMTLIRKEDRYEAELFPALTMLPSFTQLGMAALLPNKELSLAEDDTGTVFVDGQNSRGKENRIKILKKSANATAVIADDLMDMNKEESRALIRDHDVVYVYHNRIDSIGDKRDSEERTFEAAEETLHELIKIIKKLTGANANNIIVTADHGFIYQNNELDESDFSTVEPTGEQILYKDRRFVLGKGLLENNGLMKFNSKDLIPLSPPLTKGDGGIQKKYIDLVGNIEIQIPKSINRLRLKGSGSRYVHGGASLQEIVIPVIQINKKRQSDISTVNVDILRGVSSLITSGQLSVSFYQKQPVSDKIQPRSLRAGIYNQNGELISDSHDLSFDLASENAREREVQVQFILTKKADEANGQEVTLRLEEQEEGTSHYREYGSVKYTMRKSFTSDFDF